MVILEELLTLNVNSSLECAVSVKNLVSALKPNLNWRYTYEDFLFLFSCLPVVSWKNFSRRIRIIFFPYAFSIRFSSSGIDAEFQYRTISWAKSLKRYIVPINALSRIFFPVKCADIPSKIKCDFFFYREQLPGQKGKKVLTEDSHFIWALQSILEEQKMLRFFFFLCKLIEQCILEWRAITILFISFEEIICQKMLSWQDLVVLLLEEIWKKLLHTWKYQVKRKSAWKF